MKFDESAEPNESKSSQVQSTMATCSRPTSLRTTSLLSPEKEPIVFDVNLIGAPQEIQTLVENIKAVAKQYLYHWKSFPISIPEPLYNPTEEQCDLRQSSELGKYNSYNLRDLFITPPFDELDAVALDCKGEPKRLNNVQLKTIRERGEFDVPSQNFPGQKHQWRLSKILQKGSIRSKEQLLDDLARSAGLIFVTAKERIFGNFFSLAESLRALAKGFLLLIDIFFGIPSLLAHDLENKIKEERSKFLVAELICRPEHEECMDSLTTYVRSQLQRAATEKFDIHDIDCEIQIPYLFLTPKELEIDLRLFSRSIMRKALPILLNILERERRGWFLHFRERLISELRDKKMTDTEIEEEVNAAVMQEYLQRVYSSVLNHPELAELGDKISNCLVQQAQSVVIMQKAYERVERDIRFSIIEQKNHLVNEYPVLSRVKPWLKMKLKAAELHKLSKCKWSVHEEALNISQKHNLQQTAYFISRDLTFMREREPVFVEELRKIKTPTRCFCWPCRIWSPKNWIVRRNFQGFSEVIPNVICQQATSIVTPRSDPSQPIFLVEKEVIRKNSTRWPFWRLLNLLQRIWCYVWNAMYLLGFVVPYESPVSIRALLKVKPFMPQLELSQVNGTLFPRKTSITQTLASRLLQLWRHVSKARTRFETEADTGFISKAMKRIWNKIWNYFFKGFIGTMFIIFIFPIICLGASSGSIFLALTSPLWVPVCVIILHFYIIFIYDIDYPNDERNRFCTFMESIVWNILIRGCLQSILCFSLAMLCPIAATIVFFFSIVRYAFRLMWDLITFHVFIKNCGRIPSNDSFAVKRIYGPGLASDFFFLIKAEQALAAFEAKMEIEELKAYEKFTENFILQPQRDFRQFVEACFGMFSCSLDSKAGSYKNLERESQDLINSLNEKLEKRQRELQINLSVKVKSRIRLSTKDLRIAIQHGAHLLERFYPNHIFQRISITEEEFWDSKNLQIDDWAGLAGLLYTEIFSLDFLTPLSESDAKFNLEPHLQLDLRRYIEMVRGASDTIGLNGPDLLGNVYAPRGNIHVHSPYLEVSAFNPRSNFIALKKHDNGFDPTFRSTVNILHRKQALQTTKNANNKKIFSWMQWKQKDNTRESPVPQIMLNPLPILHPICIAIQIYNRDSDDPIDNICWDILRAIEEYNKDNESAVNFVSRYRGRAGDEADEGDGRSGMTSGDPSIGSLDVDDNNDDINSSKSSYVIAGGPEKLPCGAKSSDSSKKNHSTKSFQWTLSNWGTNKQNIRVDLASPEDISLDTDNNSSRVVYGTTV